MLHFVVFCKFLSGMSKIIHTTIFVPRMEVKNHQNQICLIKFMVEASGHVLGYC